MTREGLRAWVEAYERLWRTPGTDGLGEIFAADVVYRAGPFEAPVRGLDALRAFWEAERDGHDEAFELTHAPVAVEGDVGVARLEVRYGTGEHWQDLWIVELDAGGRCVAFEEWPVAPS